MSGFIADLFYDKNHAKWRWRYGNETFYNERNELIEFDTVEEAVQWLQKEKPQYTMRIKLATQLTLDTKGDKDGNNDSAYKADPSGAERHAGKPHDTSHCCRRPGKPTNSSGWCEDRHNRIRRHLRCRTAGT